jgi:hypothetical protein
MSLASEWRARYRDWNRPKPHPVTGDMLQPGERVTWLVMSVYRRWSVFFFLQVLTVVWWSVPSLFPGGTFGWNLIWSDLAVVVEMMVGISFLNQSMRDARVIREELAQVREDARLIREIHDALCPGEPGAVVSVRAGDGERKLEIRPS